MSIKKILLWYCMLTKRLFHKLSFIVLLCCIPIMVLATNAAMTGESGVLTIFLYTEDGNPGADEVIDKLLKSNSVILFKKTNDFDDALNQVKQHEADAVWCFENSFDERMEKYAKHESIEPLVKIYEREETIPLQLSKEKLYGAIYNKFSYNVYENFVYTRLLDESQISEEELEMYYERSEGGSEVVEFENMNKSGESASYLMTPLRGILSLLIILCGLAAAMYFLKDKNDGKFDWLPAEKRIVPAFAQCLSAIVPAAVAVVVAIVFTDISVGIFREIVSMLLFMVASTGFCLLMSLVFRSSGKLGAAVPAILIVMLAVSPIFLNLQMLKPVSILTPSYYYLKSVYNTGFYLYFIAYIICVYGVAMGFNFLFKNKYR